MLTGYSYGQRLLYYNYISVGFVLLVLSRRQCESLCKWDKQDRVSTLFYLFSCNFKAKGFERQNGFEIVLLT